jgi:hypothetical protein
MITKFFAQLKVMLFGGCAHDWSSWEDGGSFAYELYQVRYCKKCGIKEQRNAGYALHR